MRDDDFQDKAATLAKDAALLAKDIEYIKAQVNQINMKLDENYVTQDEFDPIKKIVYGMVSVILLAVLGAIVALVVREV